MVKTKNRNDADAEEVSTSASPVQKAQGRKRKRHSSDSSNNDELVLPDNALETERNVHASAVKNNLDETSVRKIIKKVVTNDHVLALVKLREEEENSASDDKALQPKLTRAKVKELKKVSPKSAPWNLENLELSPIKHIPVKTRPEVKALIAQELPEDEDDEEYEPTHDDVPSDDDHTESCSDLDSQPRTPATPAAILPDSPQVVKDGPFKVPQDVSTARRKLQIEEEEATIALRTRSKLSLSATSIEHIESTFIPPDDLPVPDVDDLWNDFLTGCLDPASNSKHEDDDEADPEYNVAADQDAHEEDEETLGNSLIKISKKELNDLVTELFNIMPSDQNIITETVNNSVLSDASHNETRWEGKQEPTSDYEKPSQRLKFEEKGYKPSDKNMIIDEQITDQQNIERPDRDPKVGYNFSREPLELNLVPEKQKNQDNGNTEEDIGVKIPRKRRKKVSKNKTIEISIEEGSDPPAHLTPVPPASLRTHIHPEPHTVLKIEVTPCLAMTPEQVLILQQQVRQHVQLSTSNFMQLFVHPLHWKLAPTYKDYLESLMNLVKDNEKSVVNVCNLKKAHELVLSWEDTVSKDTPENRKMIEFIQSEVARTRRRVSNNALCVGEFHETFKEIVCNSSVFLYPYLLPAMPYRPDFARRFAYLQSEDALIVLGLDQFWGYIEANPDLFKRRKTYSRKRRGLNTAVTLVVKHMFPWTTVRTMLSHIFTARVTPDNPIYNYFQYNELPKTEHRLLPYNPDISLYSQPEHEMPKIWVRYLAKSSKRFRRFQQRRPNLIGRPPDGVSIDPGVTLETKKPLPIDFIRKTMKPRMTLIPLPSKHVPQDNYDITIQHEESLINIDLIKDNSNCTDVTDLHQNEDNSEKVVRESRIEPSNEPKNFYKLVQTSSGPLLVPLQVTQTVNSSESPITTPAEVSTKSVTKKTQPQMVLNNEHCTCCIIMRQICKEKQTRITDYFKSKHTEKRCYCSDIKHPNISKRLKLLALHNKNKSEVVFNELQNRLEGRSKMTIGEEDFEYEDIMYVYRYQTNVFMKSSLCRRLHIKRRFYMLLSHFNIESGCPITLAKDLAKAYDVELVDLYQDFLGFLTPQQADEIGQFRDYFNRNCAKELMDKIEAEVSNKQSRIQILRQLKECFTSDKPSCEMCTALLYTMRQWPKLALHTFHMFPHRKESRSQMYVPMNGPVQAQQPDIITEEQTQNTVHNDAEHSSSEEDSLPTMSIDLNRPEQTMNEICMEIKEEPQTDDRLDSDVTIDKTDYDSDTTISVYDIKSEDICHWRRDEDKMVLEVLQEHLTTEERNAQTILELLEDKHVYDLLSQSLTDRSLPQIKERVKHILSLLIITESNKV